MTTLTSPLVVMSMVPVEDDFIEAPSIVTLVTTMRPKRDAPPPWLWILAWAVSTSGAALAFYAVGIVIFGAR